MKLNGIVTQAFPASGGGANLQLLPPNPRRRYLRISHACNAIIYINTAPMTATNQGVSISIGNTAISQTLVLSYDDVGELLTRPWHIFTQATNGAVTVVEGLDMGDQ